MSALEIWRRQIRPMIPRGFLRRDQGEGLLISDFPRFEDGEQAANRLRQAGFSVDCHGGMARIDGTKEKYQALWDGLSIGPLSLTDEILPLYALGRRLEVRKVPLEYQPMDLIHLTLKYLDAGDEEGLLRLLPPRIALLQRRRLSLPSLAGALILNHLVHCMKGADAPC